MTFRGNVNQTLALTALACLSLLSGCPQSTMIDAGGDAGEESDVPRDTPVLFDLPPPPDAPRPDVSGDDAPSVDAPAPEPCPTAGAIETVACGMCGTRDRFCTSGLTWEYTACTGERGECMAGSTRDSTCGRCGTTRERCDVSCNWVAGACTGETGICAPGQTEVSSMGCPTGEIHRRTCDAMCAWGAFDTCTGSPDDLDGDSFGGAVDCDDTNAAIFPGII